MKSYTVVKNVFYFSVGCLLVRPTQIECGRWCNDLAMTLLQVANPQALFRQLHTSILVIQHLMLTWTERFTFSLTPFCQADPLSLQSTWLPPNQRIDGEQGALCRAIHNQARPLRHSQCTGSHPHPTASPWRKKNPASRRSNLFLSNSVQNVFFC